MGVEAVAIGLARGLIPDVVWQVLRQLAVDFRPDVVWQVLASVA